MKKLLVAAGLLILWSPWVSAQEAGRFGAGVLLGDPFGATAKYWLDRAQAVDVALGHSGNHVVHGDWLWHDWNILPQTRSGNLGAYLGLGLRIETPGDTQFGIRTVAGISYWPKGYPLELFGEAVPVMNMVPDGSLGIDGGVGLRFYFGSSSLGRQR